MIKKSAPIVAVVIIILLGFSMMSRPKPAGSSTAEIYLKKEG